MSYHWFNRNGILRKEKERYSKEKAAEYYWENKEAVKEKSRDRYKNKIKQIKQKHTRLNSTKEKGITNWFSTKKKHYKINELCFCSIKEWVKRH